MNHMRLPTEGSSPEAGVLPSLDLHATTVDRLGVAMCSGEMASGSVVRIDELEERFGVSRSVVREALRVLASMGMVASRRRVGVQIRPATAWNLYDPQVIRWRLASHGRVAQLRSLTELRTAVEPQAASLAALRAPLSSASELVGLSGKLWEAGRSGDTALFLRLDIEFHRLVLSSSGNEMFGMLDSLIAEVLTGRTHYGLMPQHPHEEALQMHVDVAGAIQRGNSADAHAAMLAIMTRAMDEMSMLWNEEAHQPVPS